MAAKGSSTVDDEETDSYRYDADRWSVCSPDDMQRLGLKEGDAVDIVSAHGVMQAAGATLDLLAGNVLAYYPEAAA